MLEDVLQVGEGFQVVGFGRFNQRVNRRTGTSALGGIGKQPGFATDRKRADGVFDVDVADVETAIFAIANERTKGSGLAIKQNIQEPVVVFSLMIAKCKT